MRRRTGLAIRPPSDLKTPVDPPSLAEVFRVVVCPGACAAAVDVTIGSRVGSGEFARPTGASPPQQTWLLGIVVPIDRLLEVVPNSSERRQRQAQEDL